MHIHTLKGKDDDSTTFPCLKFIPYTVSRRCFSYTSLRLLLLSHQLKDTFIFRFCSLRGTTVTLGLLLLQSIFRGSDIFTHHPPAPLYPMDRTFPFVFNMRFCYCPNVNLFQISKTLMLKGATRAERNRYFSWADVALNFNSSFQTASKFKKLCLC